MKKILIFLALAAIGLGASAQDSRRARNYVAEGNKYFRQEQYKDAEVAYRKAIENDAAYDVAAFNLAAALLKQRSTGDAEAMEAANILNQLATSEATSDAIAEKAFYNLGNLAFNKQDYAQSVNLYKNALRKNPDNDDARDNLYLAQKMLQQQQQNQDQNQDKNKDQDQQDQDKQKQDQQKQDQNKDQNQDKNKDQQNKDQNQQQNQQQNPDQNQQKQQPQQQQPGQISPENAQQILKTMENEEAATRARIERQNAERKKGAANRRPISNPW